MNIQELISTFIKMLNLGAVYYVIQLVRCTIVSFAVFAAVCFLRKTILKNSVFLKSALWCLFIPVLFTGRMRFFYENRIGLILFTSWTGLCIRHVWICWLYLAVVFGYACLLSGKRRKLKKLVKHMKRSSVLPVYVAQFPVSPFAVGLFHPGIVVPRVILDQYDEKEIQIILLHEKVHIRLGHLLCYFCWDILRVLLWINPLFVKCMKDLREDMEEVCDWVTIRKSGQNAYAYGKLLVKSMRVLQAEEKAFSMYAAFAGNEDYETIRQRIAGIARYKPYKQRTAASVLAAGVFCAVGLVIGIQSISYGRINEMDQVFIYDESGSIVTDGVLREIVAYDDAHVYVMRKPFEKLVRENHMGKQIFIVFGGYHKLPGIGGYGYSCQYVDHTEEKVVRIPYEKNDEQWVIKLYRWL